MDKEKESELVIEHIDINDTEDEFNVYANHAMYMSTHINRCATDKMLNVR